MDDAWVLLGGVAMGFGMGILVALWFAMDNCNKRIDIQFLNMQLNHWKFVARKFGEWYLEERERNV